MCSSLRHFSHWTAARRCFSSISALPRCWCFFKLNPSSWCHTCILYINLNHPAIQHHSRTHPPPLAHTEKNAHHLIFFFEWGNVLAIRSHHHTWITLRRPAVPYRSDLVFLHHQPWDRCQKGLILVTWWCFNRWFPVVANGNPWNFMADLKVPPKKHVGKGSSINLCPDFFCTWYVLVYDEGSRKAGMNEPSAFLRSQCCYYVAAVHVGLTTLAILHLISTSSFVM